MKHFCNYCENECIKKGIRGATQKYLCKTCGKYQQCHYKYRKLTSGSINAIVSLTKEGASISSISRLIERPKSNIQSVLLHSGNAIIKPTYKERHDDYELDEMAITVAGKKDVYLIYAINRRTRMVIDFFIGNRTKENIRKVIESVLQYVPKRIYTDGLNSYPSLIPKSIHKPGRRLTNRIERKNLTIRNLVKRLSRCTLCFTRKIEMLTAVVKLVCWSDYFPSLSSSS